MTFKQLFNVQCNNTYTVYNQKKSEQFTGNLKNMIPDCVSIQNIYM